MVKVVPLFTWVLTLILPLCLVMLAVSGDVFIIGLIIVVAAGSKLGRG